MHYSILDLAPVAEGSEPGDSFVAMRALARLGDELGYHRFWLAEHHNMAGIASAATAILIGQVAAQTRRIRVGAGGIMLPNHAPYRVAEEFGTLATLFPNRIDLGLGRAPGGDAAVMQALRRGLGDDHFPDDIVELLGYLGARREGATVRAIPGEGTDVPVWILGSSLFGATLAAALGLPYAFASHFAPTELMAARDIYRSRFQPGPWGDNPHFMLAVNLYCAPTDDEAQFLQSSSLLAFARLRTGQPGKLPAPVHDIEARVPAPVLAIVRQALGVAAVGSPATVARQMQDWIAQVAPDEIILTGNIWDADKRRESFRLAADALAIGQRTPSSTTLSNA